MVFVRQIGTAGLVETTLRSGERAVEKKIRVPILICKDKKA